MTRRASILSAAAFGAVSLGLLLLVSPASARHDTATAPIVTVVQHGGLCFGGLGRPGHECRAEYRITDRWITGPGSRPRRLTHAERASLLRAIGALDLRYLRSHPFEGVCPTATDGPETIYRFRGFPHRLATCTYDLEGVRAVELTDRLLAALKPIRR
jgi:hypothetical protein